jgi:hypothetical protein
MESQPNRRNQSPPPPPQTPSQNPQQNSSQNVQKISAQPNAFSHAASPYAYPFGWSYMHPVNPLNATPVPQMNPMYGMYYPYQVAPNSELLKTNVTFAATNKVTTESNSPLKAETSTLPVNALASSQSPAPKATPQLQKRNASLHLEDLEELEKWKAERRKRFPSRSNSTEPAKEEKPTNTEDAEEGELAESEKCAETEGVPDARVSKKPVKKRPCKYFAAGTCKNGDSCAFAHEKAAPSGQTVFEKLKGTQEREDLLKFYSILKIIVNSPSFSKIE